MLAELFVSFAPIVALLATVTMVVLRAGASRIFFDVVGSFQAERLIGDAQAKITVLSSLMLDGISGITEGVGLIGEQMQNLVDTTVPLSQEIAFARIEFEKFAGEIENADQVAESIQNIGLQYGFTADQALSAGAKMAQLSSLVGGGEAVTAATDIGMQFGLVGGMETEDAMKRMISLQQQTGFMYGDLTKDQYDLLSAQNKANLVRESSITMLNQLNTIENRSSATMSQVTHVMNQFASSAKLAGDEISYMAAMSATLIEAGEEQGKAGRALKMMYARLGADTGNNAEILRKYGVETKDASGKLRSMHDILQDITESRIMNSDAAKLEVAQAIAGNDHYVRAIKLMEQYDRTIQLNSFALNELDTAQSELNKRLEDEAFLLTQAEARLNNAQATIGSLFVPAVTRATNAQAALNEALYNMTQSDTAFVGNISSALIDAAFTMQQFGKMYAPIVEANLNMMSLNVSLQTQIQIQRALQGQDIVRASAYGQQGTLLRSNLDTISQTAAQEDRRALVAASLLRTGSGKNQQDRVSLNLAKGEVTNNEKELSANIKNLEMNNTSLSIKRQNFELLKVTNNTEHSILEKKKQSLQAERGELKTQQQKNQVLSIEGAYLEAARGYDQYKTQTAEKLMSYKKGHFLHVQAEKLVEDSITNAMSIQRQISEKELEISNQMLVKNMGLTEQQEAQFNLNKNQIKTTQAQLKAEGERLLVAAAQGKSTNANVRGTTILDKAYRGLGEAVLSASSAEQQNNMIMQAAETAAFELAIAFEMDERAVRELLMTLPPFAAALEQVRVKTKQTVDTAMLMNQTMMMSSGILGASSMALSMISDNSAAAAASMLLMQISMVPMMIQMFTMTKASYGLASGVDAYTGSTLRATKATTAFAAAMKATLVIALIAAVAYGAYRLMKTNEEESESFDNLTKSISYTNDEYQKMLKNLEEQGKGTIIGVTESRLEKQKEIVALQKEIETTTEPALLKAQEKRLDALVRELGLLEQIQAQKQATYLLEDDSAASNFYDNFIKPVNKAKAEYEREQGEFTSIPMYMRRAGMAIVQGAGESFGMDVVTPAEELEASRVAYINAMASIPEDMQGPIAELALAADDFEDFMEDLATYFNEKDIENPFESFNDNITNDFIGPIEAAKEAAFEFSNAREEMFFGMSKGNITGDMVKQVVNKGVETLINTTEVIMTNNFTGMTTTQAANEITKQVVSQLNGLGLNLNQA